MKTTIGINYHGFFKETSGISQASRMNSLAMQNAGIDINYKNYYYDKKQLKRDIEIHEFNSNKKDYEINLFQLNVTILSDFFALTTTEILKKKYNIAYWAWEFMEIPDEILPYLKVFDEIWVPSNFCVEAFSLISPIPIIKIAHPIKTNINTTFSKSELNLPENDFLFLTIFDAISTSERKNSIGTINSFLDAFSNNENVKLIIKTFNLFKNKTLERTINSIVNKKNNVILINEDFEESKLQALIKNCDALISLHRAEGFGLTMAEAMSYGKPVVATGYSGNLDYMTINNSFLVKHGFMELKVDSGILKKGYVMAEPDTKNATEIIKYVYENQSIANAIGQIAKDDIEKKLTPNIIGLQIFKRLELINNNFLKKTENKTEDLVIIENNILKQKVAYLEKTIYIKIRKKINAFFSK